MANLIGFTVTTSQTWSGRLQNWLDADGSTTLRGVPTRMGSTFANDWWRLDDACTRKPEWNMCLCDDAPTRNIASMYWTFDAGLQANVGGSICGNGNGAPCASVGKALHLGRTDMTGAMDIAPNPKITGPVGGFGWLLTLTAGAPKSITFSQVQVDDSDRLIVVSRTPRARASPSPTRPWAAALGASRAGAASAPGRTGRSARWRRCAADAATSTTSTAPSCTSG
jgi:hypothetical protein